MRYSELVKSNARKFTGDEAVMWASVEQVDDLLEAVKDTHPDVYWVFMRQAHELLFGCHFDEAYAKYAVQHMSHSGADGKTYTGEHWSLEQTNAVMSKFRTKLPGNVNEYDFYVALNSAWHDFSCWAREKFATDTEVEVAVVELAIAYWFNDTDYEGDGKVWRTLSGK